MKAMFVSFGAVLVAALAASTANAQNFGPLRPPSARLLRPRLLRSQLVRRSTMVPNYNVYPGYGPYNGPVGFPTFTAPSRWVRRAAAQA